MLETSWLWFVIPKEYVELTRPKIESRDPIFFTGTRSRSRVSGNDRLFPRGSEFGPNLEIPAGPAIQLRPGPVKGQASTCWVQPPIFDDLVKFSDRRQIRRSQMFIKLAFEFRCDVILMSHPITRSLGSKLRQTLIFAMKYSFFTNHLLMQSDRQLF